MSQPDKSETERMQREAEQRMREMQHRAQRAIRGSDMPPVPNFVRTNNNNRISHSEQNLIKNETQQHSTGKEQSKSLSDGKKGFDLLKLLNFKNLKIDNDILIIIMLIFLLSTEDTDELMLLALVYIML